MAVVVVLCRPQETWTANTKREPRQHEGNHRVSSKALRGEWQGPGIHNEDGRGDGGGDVGGLKSEVVECMKQKGERGDY
ncbi:hypothetical protein ACJ73_10064, partial [Blastomyces percursus]